MWFYHSLQQVICHDIKELLDEEFLASVEEVLERVEGSSRALNDHEEQELLQLSFFKHMAVKRIRDGHGGWAQFCVAGLGALGKRAIGVDDVELLAGALQELAVAIGAGLVLGVGNALASRLSTLSAAGAIKGRARTVTGSWRTRFRPRQAVAHLSHSRAFSGEPSTKFVMQPVD
jgi:hypothetical protein